MLALQVKLYGLSGLFKAWHDGDCSSPCSYSPSRHRKCDRDPSEHSDSVTGDKEMSEGDSEGSRGRRRKCRSIRRGGVGHGAVGGMSVQISSVRRGKHVRCSADISYGSASNCVQPLAVHRLASKVRRRVATGNSSAFPVCSVLSSSRWLHRLRSSRTGLAGSTRPKSDGPARVFMCM